MFLKKTDDFRLYTEYNTGINLVRDIWAKSNNDINCNDSDGIFEYLVQLLPIEMINLSDKSARLDPTQMFPEWLWDWDNLSANPAIPSWFIDKHIGLHNYNYGLSASNINKFNWGTFGLPSNPAITPELVIYYGQIPQLFFWSPYLDLSRNPSITPEFIMDNRNKHWNWGLDGLSENSAITPDLINANLDKSWRWNARGLSCNPSITLEFIEQHLDKQWDWHCFGLPANPGIIIGTNWDKPIFASHPLTGDAMRTISNFWIQSCTAMSTNICITPQYINVKLRQNQSRRNNPDFYDMYDISDFNWKNNGLSSNRAVTPKFVLENLDKPWDWGGFGLSANSSMTVEFFEHIIKLNEDYKLDKNCHPENVTKCQIKYNIDWGFRGLSQNRCITTEFIEKYIHMPWDWGTYGLSSNPIITLSFIAKHINEPWNFTFLSANPGIFLL
mgnify:CR=1 FL=1